MGIARLRMTGAGMGVPASPGWERYGYLRRRSCDVDGGAGLEAGGHVGHSTGGGEVVRYIGRHGTTRVAKAVLIGAVPPLMLRTEANPIGLPKEVFDGIRTGVLADRSQFFKDLTEPFYGANRPGAKVSQGCGIRSGARGCR